MARRAELTPRLTSRVFQIEDVQMMPGVTEQIIRGGRDKFALLPQALRGIRQIGVIGYKSQGSAQAQNLRDSLAGTDIRVKVGLQKGSNSVSKANAAGFNEANGTLGEMFEVISESDLVILLIADDGQVEHYKQIFAAIKPGAILGLSHGFLLGHLDNVGEKLPDHISLIGVCPKGMGDSVRRLYRDHNSGINASVSVAGKPDHRATDVALAWAIAIGSPFMFVDTLRNEKDSDKAGERGVLLGGVHGELEAVFRFFRDQGHPEEQAFIYSVESLTGPISSTISKAGLVGLTDIFGGAARDLFFQAYASAYDPYRRLFEEIDDEVTSGNETRSVLMAGERLRGREMTKIDDTLMWHVGERVRAGHRQTTLAKPAAVTAGLYAAMMMAQIDVFLSRGFPPSLICNETVIEAVDSLNPYMHARGVAYMVDNCSKTARLGTRKWGPRWDHVTMQEVLPDLQQMLDQNRHPDSLLRTSFLNHPIHQALDVCRSMRPPEDIAVA